MKNQETTVGFWNNKRLTEKEKNEALVKTCREVFSGEKGMIALNMLMTDLFFFDTAKTEKESFLNEYAKFFIRERLGVSDTKALTDFIAQTAAREGGK